MTAADAVIAAPPHVDQPIRAEVFGIERLQQHARSLAAAQRATDRPSKGRNLLPRATENGSALLAAYRDIVAAVREKRKFVSLVPSIALGTGGVQPVG